MSSPRVAGSQPSPLVAAATLTGQSVASIQYAGRGPLTVVGARIRGKGIVCDGGKEFYNGAINVLDSTLEIEGGAAIDSNRTVRDAHATPNPRAGRPCHVAWASRP